MTKLNVFTWAFSISFVTVVIGTVLKILHLSGAHLFMFLTIMLTVVYAISALSEIYRSDRITKNEKIMCTVGFIFFSTIAGILYYFIARPRMTREFKILNQTGEN